jgi:hypothetical protein
MQGLGFYPTVVERPRNKLEAISAARCAFARCQFDGTSCSVSLKRLRAYHKEWDEDRGVWKDRPRHDVASQGADAFLTLRAAATPAPSVRTRFNRKLDYRVSCWGV